MSTPILLVVRLSDSFGDLWEPLAREFDASLHEVDGGCARVVTQGCAAVVLAAGGVERAALDWIDQHELAPPVPLIVAGADPSRRVALEIVSRGANDYVALPEDLEVLRNAVSTLVDRRRSTSRRENQELKSEHLQVFRSIVGESPSIKGLLARTAKVLRYSDTTVLLVGETGTGKELLARAIHEGSPRNGAPFVTVNCSALPSHLIESELFGHERGAFTDAHAAKPGLFEVADGGTLFLDEIGTLPVDLQPKLLRVLEDRDIRRVGATKPRRVDVRIIAATNENLHESLARGSLRQDLFFRISVITFALPPLRERDDDVLLIAAHFLESMAEQHGLPVPAVTAEVRSTLLGYHWPGNIRELKNALERAMILSEPGELDLTELVPAHAPRPESGGPIPFPAPLNDIASAAARASLDMCSGNRSEAARRLGISRRRLRRLLHEEMLSA